MRRRTVTVAISGGFAITQDQVIFLRIDHTVGFTLSQDMHSGGSSRAPMNSYVILSDSTAWLELCHPLRLYIMVGLRHDMICKEGGCTAVAAVVRREPLWSQNGGDSGHSVGLVNPSRF